MDVNLVLSYSIHNWKSESDVKGLLWQENRLVNLINLLHTNSAKPVMKSKVKLSHIIHIQCGKQSNQ